MLCYVYVIIICLSNFKCVLYITFTCTFFETILFKICQDYIFIDIITLSIINEYQILQETVSVKTKLLKTV